MNLPITSRIKRSPLMQTTDPDPSTVEAGGSTGTEDKIIPGKKGTPKRTEKEAYALRGDQYKDMDFATYQGVMRKDPAYGTSGTDDIPESTVKGDKKHYKGDIKIETRGDVLEPWEKRRQSRSIKKEGRDIRRSSIKEAKIQKRLNKAESGSVREARLKAKLKENENEGKSFTSAQERGDAARASGKRPGSTGVRTGERNMTRSEAADNQDDILVQKELIKEKALREAREAANKNNLTTASSGPAGQAVSAPGGNAVQAPVYTDSTSETVPEEKASAPANMRSAFKMKGSMFNKR